MIAGILQGGPWTNLYRISFLPPVWDKQGCGAMGRVSGGA